ncbi:MAG TPA: hypothetical protein VLD38_07100 [Nitrosopumilaceae archaeon]|nr:hypothetical protein [Nitrosopumilaceae archaeon]
MLQVTSKNQVGFVYDKSNLYGVEFIGLINKQGKMEDALFENEINMTKEKRDMFLMAFRLQHSMQTDFDEEFGPVSYSIIMRENSKLVSFPSFPYLVLAIMKKNKNHNPVINKIRKALKNYGSVATEFPLEKSDLI